MRRYCAVLLVALFVAQGVRAGSTVLEGNWKVSIFNAGAVETLWIMSLKSQGGKLNGSLALIGKVAPSKLQKIRVKDGTLYFTVALRSGGNSVTLDFQAKVPSKKSTTILGSADLVGTIVAFRMEATKAANEYEYHREIVLNTPNKMQVFDSIEMLIKAADKYKVAAKEVQKLADIGMIAAAKYGARMQSTVAFRFTNALKSNEKLQGVAINVAKRAAKFAANQGHYYKQLKTLLLLTDLYKKAGKNAELTEVTKTISAIESKAHDQYMESAMPFAVEKFKGRKAKSKRRVLVELFTGAQCPPCIAADLAFDGFGQTYSSDEVILLQYHLHIPGPDALANADTEARQKYYDKHIEGTPTMFFNGTPTPSPGGYQQHAALVYQKFRGLLEPLLEKPATVDVTLKAVRNKDKIQITANVKSAKKLDGKTRLRFALAEGWVRYLGSNQLMFHHHVVRALPGGAKGFDLSKKTMHAVSVDLSALRGKLTKYLDDFAKNNLPFGDGQRPMRFADLHVVAFVQDDATGEVLQAVEVKVKE